MYGATMSRWSTSDYDALKSHLAATAGAEDWSIAETIDHLNTPQTVGVRPLTARDVRAWVQRHQLFESIEYESDNHDDAEVREALKILLLGLRGDGDVLDFSDPAQTEAIGKVQVALDITQEAIDDLTSRAAGEGTVASSLGLCKVTEGRIERVRAELNW